MLIILKKLLFSNACISLNLNTFLLSRKEVSITQDVKKIIQVRFLMYYKIQNLILINYKYSFNN